MLVLRLTSPSIIVGFNRLSVTQEHEHGPGDVRAIGMRAGCAQVYPNISKAAKILYLLPQFLILYF